MFVRGPLNRRRGRGVCARSGYDLTGPTEPRSRMRGAAVLSCPAELTLPFLDEEKHRAEGTCRSLAD